MELRATLVLLILVALYFYFGHEGEAVDVRLTERYAYVAFGDQGGVSVYKLREPRKSSPTPSPSPTPTLSPTPGPTLPVTPTQPLPKLVKYDKNLLRPDKSLLTQPEKLGNFEPLGRAISSASSGNLIYLVDPLKGLYVLRADDPTQPKEAGFITLVGANDVQVKQGRAFVTAGKAGLFILDVSQPASIRPLYHLEPGGSAGGVALFTPRPLKPLPPRWQANIEERRAYPQDEIYRVYVAAGDNGVVEYEINAYQSPRKIQEYDTPGNAVKVLVKNYWMYVADGKNGVCMLDLFQGNLESELICKDTPGDARDVFVHRGTILVADGERGLRLLAPADDPTNALEIGGFDTFGFAQSVWASRDLAYVADGNLGLWVIDLSNPNNLRMRTYIEPPGEADPYRLYLSLLYPELWSTGAAETWKNLGIYSVFMVSGFTILLVFLGQFTLPVRTLLQRLNAIVHLGWFLLRRHERLIFIKNGRILTWQENPDPTRARVVLVDQASAAAIKDKHENVRMIGPGITFLRQNEKIARTLDLRPQVRIYGPEFEENAFAAPQPGETPQKLRERAMRLMETSATTADGLEIVATIVVECKVKAQPGSGNSAYGYHPDHALRAMLSEIPRYDEISLKPAPASDWEKDLRTLVLDCWRRHIQKVELLKLFVQGQEAGKTSQTTSPIPLEEAIQAVREELTQPISQAANDQSNQHAYRKLLEHGLQVLSIQIVNLQFHPVEELRLETAWKAGWLSQIQRETESANGSLAEEKAVQAKRARVQYVQATTGLLAGAIKGFSSQEERFLLLKETAHYLVSGTLTGEDLSPQAGTALRKILQKIEEG